jgi:cytochrome P450
VTTTRRPSVVPEARRAGSVPEARRAGSVPEARRAGSVPEARRASLADLADPAVLSDPYPVLAALREASPVTEFDGLLTVVGRHADCSAVLRDPRASSERHRSLLAPPALRPAPSFLSMDPPDHTRLRRLVSKAFTPRVVATLEPRIRSLARDLLRPALADGDELEIVGRLAYPLPVRIISELLGVPAEDRPRFAGWSAALAHLLQPRFGTEGGDAESELAAAQAAREEFAAYFRGLIARRRAGPARDLLSELIRAEDEGQQLSEDELIATCVLLLVAGHETTVSLIANAILALLRHPGQLAALRADPALAAGAVEETLRYDAPVQLTARVARGGMTVANAPVPDGGLILVLLAAAGRDPAVFPDPDRFDITRPAAGHLAFGAGPHFCLGAPLARLEAAVAVREFAALVRDAELDAASLAYKPNLNLRGPARLMVRHRGLAA